VNIAKLQREVYTIAASKGWHDDPLCEVKARPGAAPEGVQADRVLAKLALIHSELSEALDENDAGRFDVWYSTDKPAKPEGFVVEIADACIRAMDTCEALGLNLGSAIGLEVEAGTQADMSSLHRFVSQAVEAARVGNYDGFVCALSGLLLGCFAACSNFGLDLDAAIRLKIEYNRTRPHRHGGKLA